MCCVLAHSTDRPLLNRRCVSNQIKSANICPQSPLNNMNKNPNVCLNTAYHVYEGMLNYTMISKPYVCNPHNCTMGSQFTKKVQKGVTCNKSHHCLVSPSYTRTNTVDLFNWSLPFQPLFHMCSEICLHFKGIFLLQERSFLFIRHC